MKIKVSELEGAKLDYWVGVAEGLLVEIKSGACFRETSFGKHEYRPSSDWSQGGPIVEREDIAFGYKTNTGYAKAHILHKDQTKSITHFGKTKLIAAMRCYVSSKFGEEVKEA